MSELVVIAHARAKAGAEEAMEKALHDCCAPSRTDPGCISYQVYRGGEDGRSFYSYERWVSKEQLDAHMGTAHVGAMFAALGETLDGPPTIDVVHEI